MTDLKHWEDKMKDVRKQTTFRDFLKEICSWRALSFYKTGKGVAKYPNINDRKLNLIGLKEYYKKYTDGIDAFQQIDMNKSFFNQFKSFFYSTEHTTIDHHGLSNENCDRCDIARDGARNAYLSASVGDNAENILYSFKAETNVRDIIASINVTYNCESVFESKTIRNSRNVFYSQYIYDGSDIWFSSNLIGCNNCFGCDGLNNQAYCINNNQYEKEEYFTQLEKLLSQKDKYSGYKKDYLKEGGIKISENCIGDGIFQCNNIENGYEVSHINNCRNILYSDGGNDSSDCYDSMDIATDTTHNLCGVYAQALGDNIYFSILVGRSSNIYYSYNIQSCSYCLGCIGLRNKQYCIFNKQYTKEDRYKIVNQIFEKMEQDGDLGKFFPGWMNPFYFNDTAAYLIDDSFTKEEVEAEGYLWRDEEIKVDIPEGVDVLHISDLDKYEGLDSSGKREINPEILTKVICDEKGNYYKIVKMEYDFLMKHGLPLPRLHWLDRIKINFKLERL